MLPYCMNNIKENTVIKEYRKDMKLEVGKDGVSRMRTRPFVDFKCHLCGKETSIAKNNYKADKPCVTCAKHLRGKVNFFKKAKEKFGESFDLSNADYKSPTTPISVRCVKHDHTFKIKPVHFTANNYTNAPHKGGCSKCAVEASQAYLRKPIEHYLEALSVRFPQFSVVSHGEAASNQEEITLTCEYHGEFTKTLHALTSKASVHLCPGCNYDLNSWDGRTERKDVSGRVYFIYLPGIALYKFGVTSREISERLKEFKQPAELIWSIDFDTLSDAYFFELNFFRHHHKLRYKGERKLQTGGYTELMTSLITKPTMRFIEETLCRKEPKTGTPNH